MEETIYSNLSILRIDKFKIVTFWYRKHGTKF